MQRKINKKLNPIISIISCITLIVSLTPAYAIEANTSGSKSSTTPFLCGVSVFNKSTSEALLTAQPATFSVTVPTALPVNVDASGTITTATDAKITNNSPGPVKVVSCQMNTLNNWAITSEPSKAKVGAKEFNFTLNDKAFAIDGAYDTSTWDTIGANNNLPLVYTSEVSPQKNAVTEAMANVVFTIDWDKDVKTPVLNAIHEIDKTKIKSVLQPLTGNITFRDSTKIPATYDKAVDVSSTGDDSVIAYVIGQDAIVQADGGVLAPVDSVSLFGNEEDNSSSTAIQASSLDLRGLDTSQTTDISFMFSECTNLTTLNVGSFDTSNVANMAYIFDGCSKLMSLELTNFNTSNVTSMSGMFYNCTALTRLDISNFDTSNVTTMGDMFNGCSKLTSLDLTNFNTPNLTNMHDMFYGCSSLTNLDLSNFDTSNVWNMGNMFGGCSTLTELNISNFDASNVEYMGGIFRDCNSLTTVYAKTQVDADKFNASSDKPTNVNIVLK